MVPVVFRTHLCYPLEISWFVPPPVNRPSVEFIGGALGTMNSSSGEPDKAAIGFGQRHVLLEPIWPRLRLPTCTRRSRPLGRVRVHAHECPLTTKSARSRHREQSVGIRGSPLDHLMHGPPRNTLLIMDMAAWLLPPPPRVHQPPTASHSTLARAFSPEHVVLQGCSACLS